MHGRWRCWVRLPARASFTWRASRRVIALVRVGDTDMSVQGTWGVGHVRLTEAARSTRSGRRSPTTSRRPFFLIIMLRIPRNTPSAAQMMCRSKPMICRTPTLWPLSWKDFRPSSSDVRRGVVVVHTVLTVVHWRRRRHHSSVHDASRIIDIRCWSSCLLELRIHK